MAYTVYGLARLANAVYDATQVEVDGWRLDRDFGSVSRGFYAALYKRDEHWVLALRGTDDGYDLIPDAQIFAALIPVQLAQAQAALNVSLTRCAKQKIALTGHSLGGGLAALLATQYGKPAVTFNAPGVARSYVNSISVVGSLANSVAATYMTLTTMTSTTLLNIRANFDVVSVGTGTQLGDVDTISVGGCMSTWDEFGARMEQLPMDMMMGRSSAGPYKGAAGMIEEVTEYVLCQHGMELMERQLAKMPEYQADLGW